MTEKLTERDFEKHKDEQRHHQILMNRCLYELIAQAGGSLTLSEPQLPQRKDIGGVGIEIDSHGKTITLTTLTMEEARAAVESLFHSKH